MHVLWFFPTPGDERYLGGQGARPMDFGYLRTLATALDSLGYYGALLPTGIGCEDAWVAASALIGVTRQLRYLVAVRPSIIQPSLAARMAATFDRLSEGRLLINVVTGDGGVKAAAMDGVFADHDTRYEITDEFLTIFRTLLADGASTFHGKHLRIENGLQVGTTYSQPYPPIWFGGSSDAGIAVAAKHADVYLTWGEPPAQVKEKLDRVRAEAARIGRTEPLRFGIRLNVVARETEGEAWDAANRLIAHLSDEQIAVAQARFAASDSVGQKRMRELHGGKRENLQVSPNLWAGLGLVRPGAGTALVGDGSTIAERMAEYAELGIDTFILSGYPHLEEAFHFAEQVFPHLPPSASESASAKSLPAKRGVVPTR
ncbi:MAG: FMNH2-dependent alkanesulfonate monooxygenase [Akkermansiaceae bacterium]|nr:FMNH2-dependent alkanesulfonate monooxygenase [Armatimonadota bacterium]